MPCNCAVSTCPSSAIKGGDIHFFAFPKDAELRQKWMQLCRRDSDNYNFANARICSRHFHPDAYERNLKYELLGLPIPSRQIKFKPGTLPTLYLPLSLGTEESTVLSEPSSGEETSIRGNNKKKIHKLASWKRTLPNETSSTSGSCYEVSQTDEKHYKCSLCCASFGCSKDLKVHTRIHSGEKPYECTFCDASFRQLSHLKFHILSHTGEKPHKCTLCAAAFRHSTSLKTHFRSHSDEGPHKCIFCKASFNEHSTLDKHIAIHTDNKPFECTLCLASFSQLSKLQSHVNGHRASCKSHDNSNSSSSNASKKYKFETLSESSASVIRSDTLQEFSDLPRSIECPGIQLHDQEEARGKLTEKVVNMNGSSCAMEEIVKQEDIEIKIEELGT